MHSLHLVSTTNSGLSKFSTMKSQQQILRNKISRTNSRIPACITASCRQTFKWWKLELNSIYMYSLYRYPSQRTQNFKWSQFPLLRIYGFAQNFECEFECHTCPPLSRNNPTVLSQITNSVGSYSAKSRLVSDWYYKTTTQHI